MLLTALIFLLATFLGGWVFVLLGQRGLDNLGVILSFGGSIIIGMCFLHLVPEAFGTTSLAGVFVIGGFLVQGLLEYLSKGIEHGHFHAHDHGGTAKSLLEPLAMGFAQFGRACCSSMLFWITADTTTRGHVHGPLSLDMISGGW